jgi:hypothetical protein
MFQLKLGRAHRYHGYTQMHETGASVVVEHVPLTETEAQVKHEDRNRAVLGGYSYFHSAK